MVRKALVFHHVELLGLSGLLDNCKSFSFSLQYQG